MIHQAPFGSRNDLLRCCSNTQGNPPLLLAAAQVATLPVTEKVHEHSKEVEDELAQANFRTVVGWRKKRK